MRHVAKARQAIGKRTIFNLLGPLTNPAGATHQVVGVAHESLVEKIGRALQGLGVRRGAVVHGCSGVDEVVADAPTLPTAAMTKSSHNGGCPPKNAKLTHPATEAAVHASTNGLRRPTRSLAYAISGPPIMPPSPASNRNVPAPMRLRPY